MAEGLKIQVGVDVEAAIAGVKKLEKTTDQLGTTLSGTQRQVTSFGGKISSIPPSVDAASKALNKTVTSSNAASLSLTNLGRVAQDAPFGFIGIANNLNPLLESFQRLQAQTGSAGSAFKALGKELGGVGGIGFAISLISSALIVFGDELTGSSSSVNQLTRSLEVLANQSKNSKDQIKDFSDELAFLREAANITIAFNFGDSREAIDLKGKIQTGTINEELNNLRKNLELSKKRGDELFETLNKKGSRKAFDVLIPTNGLYENILDADIESVNKKSGEILKALRDNAKEYSELQKQIRDKQNEATLSDANRRLALFQRDEKDRKEAAEKAKAALAKSKADYEKYVSETIALAKKYNDAFKNGIDLKLNFNVFDTQASEFRKSIEYLAKFNAGQLRFVFDAAVKINVKSVEFPPPDDIGNDARTDAQRLGDIYGKEFSQYFAPNYTPDLGLEKALQASKTPAAIAAQNLGVDTAKALNEGLKSLTVDGIASFAESIGKVLSGGDIGDAFAAFANVLADGVTAIGKQLIAIGVAAALANTALQSLFTGPGGAFLAIAAGAALVAAGAALKSTLGGGIKGFAAGGLVFGPTLGLVGEGSGTNRNNPEVIAPLDQLKGFLSGIGGNSALSARIKGKDLLLSQSRTSRSQRRTTGK